MGQITGPIRTGVWFQGNLTVPRTVELARAAEAAGVDAVWLAEGPVARDAFVTLTAIAAVTSHVTLGTGVVNPFTRHPAQLAACFATLDEASGGRAICGLGIGARDHLAPIGADVSKPLTTAREMVAIVRGLLNHDVVTLQGAKFDVDGVRLGFRPPRERIPIYLAATGPNMCRLAGETDGIYFMYGTREYVRDVLAQTEASRDPARPFGVASPILMAVDDDPRAAGERLKAGIGLMLTEPNGEAMLEANGLDPVLVPPIRDALAAGGVRGVRDAVDDAIIEKLTIAGTAAQCLERLRDAVSWGITEPQILLTGDDPAAELAVLAELRRTSGDRSSTASGTPEQGGRRASEHEHPQRPD